MSVKAVESWEIPSSGKGKRMGGLRRLQQGYKWLGYKRRRRKVSPRRLVDWLKDAECGER